MMGIFAGLFGLMFPFLIIAGIILLTGFRVINQYEKGVKFTLGKYSGLMTPGLRFIIPIFQWMRKVDMRTRVIDVPDQDAITKDNVTLKVNAVLYYRVIDAEKSILEVENYSYAVSQLSQTTMRDIVGETSLDDLLSNRDVVSKKIKEIVDKATDPWGIKISSVELKHVELPQELQRTMGKEAEAEREKRSVIIKAEGEVIAAQNISKAAKLLSSTEGALHLRTLQTLNDLSSDQSNTIVMGVPLEILRAFEKKK